MRILRLSLLKFRALTGGMSTFAAVLLTVALCCLALSGALSAQNAVEVHIALVDEDHSSVSALACDMLSTQPGLIVTAVDAHEAARLLSDGQVEGVVTLISGFGDAVVTDNNNGTVRYEAGSASYASLYIQEVVSGCLLSVQASVTAQQRAAAILGHPLTDEESTRLEQEMQRYQAESRPLYTVTGQSNAFARTGGLFSSVFARYYGFASFASLLCVLTIAGGLSGAECRLCEERLRLHRHGAMLAAVTDLLALALPGLAILLVAAVLRGITFRVVVFLTIYALCIAAAARALALKTAIPGRIGLAAPAAAFFTSLLGGCFADLSALSPVLRIASFFTPQGLLLRALDGDVVWPVLVLAATTILTLLPTFRCPSLTDTRR